MTGPVTSAEWLAQHLADESVRIADTRWYLGEPERGRAEYAAGHIPGAVYLDLERDLSGPATIGAGRHPLPDLRDLALRLGDLGIGPDHHVVAYDSRGGAVAARLWWMLRATGHQAVSVLDGGLRAWLDNGGDLTVDVPTHEPTQYPINLTPAGTVDRAEIKARLPDLILVDARSGDRYRGETEPIDPVAGHIPTAVSAPYEDNLDPAGRMRPAPELATRYAALGVTTGEDVVVYCGSGVTACHDLLALEVAGIEGARLYVGSWSEWATAGEAAATGPEPSGD